MATIEIDDDKVQLLIDALREAAACVRNAYSGHDDEYADALGDLVDQLL